MKLGQRTAQQAKKRRMKTFYSEINSSSVPFDLSKCKTPQGELLTLQQWHWDYWEWLMSDQIGVRVVSGCAQIGKTLFIYLSTYENLINRNYSLLWAYPTQKDRDTLVKEHHKRLKDQFGFEGKDIRTDTLELFQYKNNSVNFMFVRSPERNQSGASAKRVGVTADKLLIEETSKHNQSELETVFNRQDASKIVSNPRILLGTPGSGGGIEVYINRCHYQFYPHCMCESCGGEIILTPKGCLLKPFEKLNSSGEKIQVYLSESGKPVEWWHKDPLNAVETAYFACPHCGQEISQSNRVTMAYFRCKKTGKLLKDYLKEIEGINIENKSSSIELSPLLRDTGYNLASKMIKDGLDTANPDNWQQQTLGLPSETSTTQLTPAIIKKAIAAPVPDRNPDFILCGIDQGRSEHWLVIVAYYLPEGWEQMSFSELAEKTIRGVEWCGGIQKGEIKDKLNYYKVNFGIIDNEPDIAEGSNLCEFTQGILEMADQRVGQLEEFKEGEAMDGGDKYPCWKIRSEKYMKMVLHGFIMYYEGYPLYRCPESWQKWEHNNSERSPIKHLCSPSLDPETGKWIRQSDHVDDIYYAFHFCESAFAIYMREHTKAVESRRAYGY